MAINKESRNRAVVILIIGILIASWIMINAGQFLQAAVIYIVLGLISIIFYFNWNQITTLIK